MSDENSVHKIFDAALFAAQKHANQRRKRVDAEPYINNLIEAAQLVANATTPAETEEVIAALLHDSIEDIGLLKQELSVILGQAVAELAIEVTDDQTKPQIECKRFQVVNAPFKSAGAGLIKLADKISKLSAINASPPAGWSSEKRRGYGTCASEIVESLDSPNPILRSEFN